MFHVFIICLVAACIQCQAPNLNFEYHNYESLTELLKSYAQNYPDKAHLHSIGQSVEGRELWVLSISDQKPNEHVSLRPEAKYIGNIHGNEVASKELLLRLVDYMLKNQNVDSDVDFIMKNTRVSILPSMNPDGYEISQVGDCDSVQGRTNANNYDLNRNFPDLFELNEDQIQPETNAVINWLESNHFILSASLHGGALVVNYPYDNFNNSDVVSELKSNPTDDNDVFISISKNYSYNHANMIGSYCNGEYFQDGITNGAEWYPIKGGMQDFNYWKHGCYEVTIEVSCCKFPPIDKLESNWNDNKKSLIEFLKKANTGVRGIVFYSNNKPAENLTVNIGSREPYFKTDKLGEYYRILLPGTYNLTIMAECELLYQTSITIDPSSELLEFNITLTVSRGDISKSLNKYPVFCSDSQSSDASDPTYDSFIAMILSKIYDFFKYIIEFILNNLF